MPIPGLRSPYEKVGPFLYFGRMLDKIRLRAADQLPADYVENLGEGFDRLCVQHLGVDYAAVVEHVKKGGDDAAILEWCRDQGRLLTEQDIFVWNEFMRKRGWNDSGSERLAQRKTESNLSARDDVQTFFDYIDADEGRPLAPR